MYGYSEEQQLLNPVLVDEKETVMAKKWDFDDSKRELRHFMKSNRLIMKKEDMKWVKDIKCH